MYKNVGEDGAPIPGGGSLGALFRLSPDGRSALVVNDIGIANTLCWSPDASHFYSADIAANVTREYRYDRAFGSISDGRPFFSGFERGLPDGSAMDRDGYLWNCRYGGGGITRIAPDGRLDRFIEIPALNVTSCTFGGPDLTTLFVATAANNSPAGYRLAGSLWAIETGIQGLEENRYRVGVQGA